KRMSKVVEKLKQEVIAWRRHFHENPELSYKEFQTSEFVYQQLKQMPSMEVSRPTATSVLAVLKGQKHSVDDPLTIAFRADMDALPIQEEADVPFVSKNPGVMHACGHDAHTAI